MPIAKRHPDPDQTTENAQKCAALAAEIAALVLREGLGVLALRGLAARLETSARMLMYYFGTKENLVVAAMEQVVLRLQAILAYAGDGPPQTPGRFLAAVLALSNDPEVAPFMRVLTELVARAARGEAPYDRIAKPLVAAWVDWIDSRLMGPTQPGQAAALLGIVEGITLLEMAAKGSAEAAGPYLSRMLDSAKPD